MQSRLKTVFLIAAGVLSFSMTPQDPPVQAKPAPVPQEILTQELLPEEKQATFDYAFGDQTAASLGVPGATGTNWNTRKTYKAFNAFLETNPGALKGKNVFVSIGNDEGFLAKLWGFLFAKAMVKAVGPTGNIVLTGISETRTDLKDAAGSNRELHAFIKEYKVIYGGPLQGATSKNNIYPVTTEAFRATTQQAQDSLNAHIKRAKMPAISNAASGPR